MLIRKIGDNKVYRYRNSELKHIPDPPTLRLLGFHFADVQDISKKEFRQYTIRPPLDSVLKGKLIKGKEEPHVYIIIGEEKRHVPDLHTLQYILYLGQRSSDEIETLEEDVVASWPTGKPLSTILQL